MSGAGTMHGYTGNLCAAGAGRPAPALGGLVHGFHLCDSQVTFSSANPEKMDMFIRSEEEKK
jgi:hypothetical protein